MFKPRFLGESSSLYIAVFHSLLQLLWYPIIHIYHNLSRRSLVTFILPHVYLPLLLFHFVYHNIFLYMPMVPSYKTLLKYKPRLNNYSSGYTTIINYLFLLLHIPIKISYHWIFITKHVVMKLPHVLFIYISLRFNNSNVKCAIEVSVSVK